MSWNFFAAHAMARAQAAEPVGRPPMPSHSSRRSVNKGVSPFARAASLFGESCASKAAAKARLDKIVRLVIVIVVEFNDFRVGQVGNLRPIGNLIGNRPVTEFGIICGPIT